MANIGACLVQKAVDGKVDTAKARAMRKEFDEQVEDLEATGLSKAEAEEKVSQTMEEQADRQVVRKKTMAMVSVVAQERIRKVANTAEANGISVRRAMNAVLSMDRRELIKGVPNVESRIHDVKAQIYSFAVGYLDQFRTKSLGFRQDKAGLPDFIRQMFGKDTGNASAKELAEGLMEGIEYARLRFNAAGGDVIKREDWGLWQYHDASKMARVSGHTWVKFILDEKDTLLDLDKMLDGNGNKLSNKKLKEVLGRAYEDMVSGGILGNNGPTISRGHGSPINRRAKERQLIFKDADAWMKYHARFGKGDIFDHINGAIDTLARDIAILEILGPYGEATVKFMDNLIADADARGAIAGEGSKAARSQAWMSGGSSSLKNEYDILTGRNSIPEGSGWFGTIMAANRSYNTIVSLGNAFVAALGGDFATMNATAGYNGLSTTKMMGRYLKLWTNLGDSDRRMALRGGFIVTTWSNLNITSSRLLGDTTGPQIMERATDTSMRVTGLTQSTENYRMAFGLEMLANMTHEADKVFNDISEPMQRSFERYGIDAEDWDIIRTSERFIDPETGADMIIPNNVSRGEFNTRNFDVANKLQQQIYNETSFAVITQNSRTQNLLQGGSRPNTLWGEVRRSVSMFKGWPIAILGSHIQRGMAAGDTKWGSAVYMGKLSINLTLAGAFAVQMMNLASGRDVEEMESADFWLRAFIKGGAGGIIADTLMQEQGWGRDMWDGLLGPVAAQMADVVDLTAGTAGEALDLIDEDADLMDSFRKKLARTIQRNAPGKTGWWFKLAWQRMFLDQVRDQIDPDAAEGFYNMERRAEREHGQNYWWSPGDFTPSRGPELP